MNWQTVVAGRAWKSDCYFITYAHDRYHVSKDVALIGKATTLEKAQTLAVKHKRQTVLADDQICAYCGTIGETDTTITEGWAANFILVKQQIIINQPVCGNCIAK